MTAMATTIMRIPEVVRTDLTVEEASLLAQVSELLAGHPAGRDLCATVAAPDAADGQMLVQTVSGGVVSLRARGLDRVTTADTIHATQVIDPALPDTDPQMAGRGCYLVDTTNPRHDYGPDVITTRSHIDRSH